MTAGQAVTGPVTWGERAERALLGLPVQQLESLLREATPGELLLSREVHEELREAFEQAGYRLAPRRGVISPQPLYVVSGLIASRVTLERSPDSETLGAAAGRATLSGISPGALLGAALRDPLRARRRRHGRRLQGARPRARRPRGAQDAAAATSGGTAPSSTV